MIAFLAALVPLSPLVVFPAVGVLVAVRNRPPRGPYATFTEPAPRVERRICQPCRVVRRVEVSADGTVLCEQGHVSGGGA